MSRGYFLAEEHVIPIRIHHLETVESTNDVALEMARKGEPEGSVVVARRQLEGRGRRGRVWLDKPGSCVLMSAVFLPPTSSEKISPKCRWWRRLRLRSFSRERFGIEALVKWPNDVLVRDRKIAGILVEVARTTSGTWRRWSGSG